MTGTTYRTNRWMPPYRVCNRCEADEPVRSDRTGTPLPGPRVHGTIATCDRPDHFTRQRRGEESRGSKTPG